MLELITIELYGIAVLALIFAAYKLRLAAKNYRYKKSNSLEIRDEDLPSVSVCIPARNETNSMTECLESVLASDYPKLEVMVLDDNSKDNTSHLIKAFAHAGVRFIAGRPRPNNWLGKNFALETLLSEASGKYVLFMDVDTRLKPSTIRRLVEKIIHDKSQMISIIPRRDDSFRSSAWLSTLRYFWEIILDSRIKPGSSSAAWIIRRRMLADELGGFSAWKSQIQPELYIARELAKTSEHKLLISAGDLGVSFAKKWSSQIETSRRLLLPRFRNSTISALVGAGLLILIVLPQVVTILAFYYGTWSVLTLQILLSLLASGVFAYYCWLVWRSHWWIALLVGPYVAWQEIFLLISSVVGYYRGTITWKGRVIERPTRQSSDS